MGDPNVLSSEASGIAATESLDNAARYDANKEINSEQNTVDSVSKRKVERANTVDLLASEDGASVAGSISGKQSNCPKRNVRERYHSVKQHVLRAEKNSTPKEALEGIRSTLPLDVSAVEPSINKLNHSFTYPEDLNMERQTIRELTHDSGVGEDFVNSKRRMRRARGQDCSERSSSGVARSEIGEYSGHGIGFSGYRMHPATSRHFYDPRSMYSLYRDCAMDGRRSVGLMHQYFPYDTHSGYSDVMVRRRPQSSFEAVLNPRHGMVSYDAEEEIGKKSDSSSSRRDETGSDEEVAAIHYQQEMARRSVARFDIPNSVSDEYYYFGVIQLPQDKIQTILYKTPPPSGYFHLPPMEKAAYLFYFVLYNRYFTPVEEFHNRFNREFFKYSCEGDSAETALWKICKHTQEEYVARRSAYQLKAYEKTQKQLFSDDRETPDSRVSDRGSRYDQEEESDRLSVDSASKEPLKFRTAHAFAKFCVGGKVLVVNPENALSVIEIHDVKSFAADSETQLLIETIEMFHGPLIPGVTPPHSVSLYIQRQIDHILKSDIYKANPHGSDASDCLLVWQLLKMIVQQQGRVTGPDIARLLMCDYDSAFIPEIYRSVFGSGTNDGSGFQRYMKFLLGGHVDEAIECAIKDGLLLDAMVLARWVCPHKLDKVDAAFLAQRAEQNPVMTLLSVAHDLPAPILLNPPTDDAGSWRSHAAIILANLSTDTAFKMVYNLGRVLARREYHAAADFCFLAVSLLSDCDPFALNATNEDDDAQDCQHITLVHASLPDDKIESRQCSFGFSVVDLHATEIYEYGLRLACNGQPVRLTQCCDYQKYRFKYAQLLSEYGGFAPDAYHYCVEIAKGIADKWMEYGKNDMLQLCDMADRLQHIACADQAEIAWFSQVRSFIEQYQAVAVTTAAAANPEPQVHNTDLVYENPSDIQYERTQQKTRTLSFGLEAAEWHADHQEPIQISPFTSSGATATSVFTPQEQQNQQTQPQESQSLDVFTVPETQENQQVHDVAQRRASLANSVASAAGASQLDNTEGLSSKMQSLSINESKNEHPQEIPSAYSQYYEEAVVTSESMTDNDENTEIIMGLDRRDPQNFCNNQQPNDFAISQSNVMAKNDNFKHSLAETSGLEVPSPSGMDDSVFTAGDDQTHTSMNYSSEIAAHQIPSNANYQNNIPLPPVPPVNSHVDGDKQSNVRSNTVTSDVPDENKLSKPPENPKSLSASSHSSGIFGMLKAKLVKAIPSPNDMILPDDKNPSIVWDPVQQKYVGDGVEKGVDSKPPSSANFSIPGSSANDSQVGLTAARFSGGLRYLNTLNGISSSQSTNGVSPVPTVPSLIAPPTSGFFPTLPPDNDDTAGANSFGNDASSPLTTS